MPQNTPPNSSFPEMHEVLLLLGRIDARLDSHITEMRDAQARIEKRLDELKIETTDLDDRIGALERAKMWLIGAAAPVMGLAVWIGDVLKEGLK